MKALSFSQYGPVERSLKLIEKPIPDLQPEHSLVKLVCASINPADLLFIEGRYQVQAKFPQTCGLDGVGIVEDGDGALKGTLVAFRHPETWAEYALIPNAQLVSLSADYSLHKASQLLLNAATAYGLLDVLRIRPQSWLLLTAGSSVVSKLTLQFARKTGLKVLSVIRDPTEANRLYELGADGVILSKDGANLRSQVLEFTRGEGIDGCCDCVGGSVGTEILQAMKIEGKYVLYGVFDRSPIQVTSDQIIYKEILIRSFRINRYISLQADRTIFYGKLAALLNDPKIEIDIAGEYPLDQFEKALVQAKKGKVLFKF